MNSCLKDEYKQQMTGCCSQIPCYKVFCRDGLEDEAAETLSELLSRYGDVFLCRNIRRTIEQTSSISVDASGSVILDFFFRLGTMGPRRGTSVEESRFGPDSGPALYAKDRESRGVLRMENGMQSVEWAKRMFRKKGTPLSKGHRSDDRFGCLKINEMRGEFDATTRLDHSICGLISGKEEITVEDRYILIGVLQLLLKKYEGSLHFTLGMIILRIYCTISKYGDVDETYYPTLYKTFDSIRSLYSEMLKKTTLSEGITCRGERIDSRGDMPICIYLPKFTKVDLSMLVDNITCILNSSEVVDSRESKRIDNLLSILHLLYLVNEECGLLSYKKFYLVSFCSRMNFREEFKHFRAKSKTPLNFQFILPVHIKAELIKYENNDRMKTSLQDSFFKSLFEGHVDPYLFITVSRETVYRDSIEIFKKINVLDARKQLRITFRNEEGVDSGGIRKEYFQLLSQEIKEDERLFEHTENRIWIRPHEGDGEGYEAIGRIIAIALYNNVVLNIPFPSLFFKKLLDRRPTLDDLREISSGIAASLRNLRRLSRDEVDSLDLRFVVEHSVDGIPRSYPLVKNGEDIKLTSENMRLFIEKYVEFHTDALIKPQFESIKRGFYSIIDKDKLAYLDPKELEKIMMGSNTFDIKAIRSTTTYSGFREDSPIIVYFWEIFEAFNRKKRKKLLQFITGNDRIPVSGPASLKLVIMRNGCDTDRLPSSQTCFNTLLLPEYSSKDKLEGKLETALELTAGFFLL
ncbi:E3 ubiquitin-protein ligase [Encephalitozoon cuniculi EcunIII-L]|uniref:HECT-type E3 ubiquitin transferase n=1 Tax=Encephalitozoon cuniculi TaxID=6035 RepID=M1JIJ3_ENCCN|nr:ubiquitin protein ligase e3a [Encephalitozoon cuniculi]KMV66251.1 E3 ubiquitin-protein ligase [Encephalitozoon cuniculi EcunIII-L]UYI27425.1 ubiquitin protein ligase [Encephalitozoon cuniculi]